jgi:hypothetical protein
MSGLKALRCSEFKWQNIIVGLTEVDYEGVNFDLTQDHVQCLALVLVMWRHNVLLEVYRRS